MLVLTRKKGGVIVIGDNIRLTVVEIGPNKVRIGIEAPKDVPVHREEIYELLRQAPTTPPAPAE